jgi:glutamine synthetase
VKAIAYKHDSVASFLPKIFADKPGNGCHLHCSLWNDAENILSDSQGEYGISEIGRQFIAGILNHLPALMAIITPIPNSYKRIRPNLWTGAYQCWGIDNREAALRIVTDHNGMIRDFELKTVDASSNPYLAFGAVIATGLDGIKKEMKLQPPIQEDPANISVEKQKEYKVKRLPSELDKAIIELKKDKVILNAMGDKLSKAYIEIKKAELRALRNLKLEDEVQLLLEKY